MNGIRFRFIERSTVTDDLANMAREKDGENEKEKNEREGGARKSMKTANTNDLNTQICFPFKQRSHCYQNWHMKMYVNWESEKESWTGTEKKHKNQKLTISLIEQFSIKLTDKAKVHCICARSKWNEAPLLCINATFFLLKTS